MLQEGESLTDGQLLRSFVKDRDENAFEVLMRRHGPMVLGIAITPDKTFNPKF
jgi:hypothetical protein